MLSSNHTLHHNSFFLSHSYKTMSHLLFYPQVPTLPPNLVSPDALVPYCTDKMEVTSRELPQTP